MKISFNKPSSTGNEEKYVLASIKSDKLSGDGHFAKQCHLWFESTLGCKKALLTPSCTHALELAAILIDIQPGDQVIMTSYTFVSTANAFVLRGATIVFVDIRPDTMNIDETKIEAAITSKTKAIVSVHYAGVGCEMETIMKIAEKYDLFVIEDAAQGMTSRYKGKSLGTIGHIGAFSFHETKNYTSGGEGGLLIVNDERFVERAEIIREKGTNRSQFFRGNVDKYSWKDIGSSYLLSDIQAAYLWGQLEMLNEIKQNRLTSWKYYLDAFYKLITQGAINIQNIPSECEHNSHIFYIKAKDLTQRNELLRYLKINDIEATFHYVPLHSSTAGVRFCYFKGVDQYTTQESERLIRLPLYYGLKKEEIDYIVEKVYDFFHESH